MNGITIPPARSSGPTLARASWLLFVGIVFGNAFLKRALGPVAADLLALALLVAGVLLAILALTRVRREGRPGIVVPAVVGLVLNGLFLLVWVTNFLAYRAANASWRGDAVQPDAIARTAPPAGLPGSPPPAANRLPRAVADRDRPLARV